MFNKSVAVLDIRSSEVTAAVAERGVNNTFIIKSKYSCKYEGYAEGSFLDVNSFYSAAAQVVSDTVSAINKSIKRFYVGVPGEFTKVICTEKTISFDATKKIRNSDVENVREVSTPEDSANYVNVKSGCVYYTLSDKRRTVNPVGEISDSLQAKLCFYMVSRTFIEYVENAFDESGLNCELIFIPEIHAQAMYLLPPEKRDEVAILVDFGYISSTFSVVCGNGLLYSESFSIGLGHLAYLLSGELDMPYEVASEFLQKVNLNAKENVDGRSEYSYQGNRYSILSSDIRNEIRDGLDGVCETIEECMHGYAGVDISYKPLYVTGEGVNVIRGSNEHISSRLARSVQTVAPSCPCYGKPQLSSLFSLMNAALEDYENLSVFKRI